MPPKKGGVKALLGKVKEKAGPAKKSGKGPANQNVLAGGGNLRLQLHVSGNQSRRHLPLTLSDKLCNESFCASCNVAAPRTRSVLKHPRYLALQALGLRIATVEGDGNCFFVRRLSSFPLFPTVLLVIANPASAEPFRLAEWNCAMCSCVHPLGSAVTPAACSILRWVFIGSGQCVTSWRGRTATTRSSGTQSE